MIKIDNKIVNINWFFSKSKYSISFDFHFSLLSLLLLSTLFLLFDELKRLNELENNSTFVRKITTIIWLNSSRWVSKKSKLNELKIMSSRETFFMIVEFLMKIDELLTKIDEFSINVNWFSIKKTNQFSIKVVFFEIKIRWATIIWNNLMNFLKRALFIACSSNQIQVSSKSINELRVRRSINLTIEIKTRKCRRQISSTINLIDRSIKLSN